MKIYYSYKKRLQKIATIKICIYDKTKYEKKTNKIIKKYIYMQHIKEKNWNIGNVYIINISNCQNNVYW